MITGHDTSNQITMSNTTTMYKATDYGSSPKIEPVTVVRLTAKTCTYQTKDRLGNLDQRKQNLEGTHESFFYTWADARAWLMGRAERRVAQARRNLESANGTLGNIKGWKEPMS